MKLEQHYALAVAIASLALAAPLAQSVTQYPGDEDWVLLGTVARTRGAPEKWLDDPGFVFVDPPYKDNVVPTLGGRIQLTTVKEIRRTNGGQRPFEREPAQSDVIGKLQPGTVLTVNGIGSTSKTGDRTQYWALVQQWGMPLPCVPAARNDPAPWVHNSRVLDSYPADVPPPQFLGRFGDADAMYALHLWRDSKGLFGEWLSPVLPADPPISRLYALQFDATSGALSFETRIRGAVEHFAGQLDGATVRGTLTRDHESVTLRFEGDTVRALKRDRMTEPVTLPRLPRNDLDEAFEQTASRAQFECEMILYHRY